MCRGEKSLSPIRLANYGDHTRCAMALVRELYFDESAIVLILFIQFIISTPAMTATGIEYAPRNYCSYPNISIAPTGNNAHCMQTPHVCLEHTPTCMLAHARPHARANMDAHQDGCFIFN